MDSSFLKALQQVVGMIPSASNNTKVNAAIKSVAPNNTTPTTPNNTTLATPSVNNELAQLQPYFQNAADSYKVQYDTQRNLLNEQRRQQQANIYSQANTAGMLYSSFPQRTQIQYDTNTYMPALTKFNTSYLTGINDLRNKGTQLANSILATQEAINDINKDIYAVS